MPQLDAALVAFGTLIGLFDASGNVQCAWFGKPLKKSWLGISVEQGNAGRADACVDG